MTPDLTASAYETCWNCRGYGVEANHLPDGSWDPVTCSVCRGGLVLRRRDERGRFAAPPPPESCKEKP